MTKESIEKLNGKYPLYIIDIADDDSDDLALVEELLDKNNLRNRRKFHSLDEYEKALEGDPDITPHIAFLDYMPAAGSQLTGLRVTIMLMKRSKAKSLRTKVIMMSGVFEASIMRKFFRAGGFDWLDKNHPEYGDQLTETVMDAIVDIEEALEERAWIDALEEDISTEK